ncbi:MAG: sensor histidine kinase [Spirochaetaceae bacterium]|nr:sensor histidine kinase [Spirochaetaceae bacterium]
MHGRIRNKILLSLNNVKMHRKLQIMYLVVFLTPMLVISIFLSQKVYITLSKWERNQAEQNLRQAESYFNSILLDIGELSDRLYANETLLRIINTEYSDGKVVYEDYLNLNFLDDYVRSVKVVRDIRFYVDNETLLNNSYFILASPSMKSLDWYKRAVDLGGKIFWTVKQDDIRGRTYFSLVRSIWDTRTKKFVGVLSINLDTDKIISFISTQQFETLICMDGTIIFSLTDSMRFLRPYFIDEDKKGFDFNEKVRWQGDVTSALVRNFSPLRGLYESFQIVYVIPRDQLVAITKQVLLFSGSVIGVGLIFSLFFIMLFSKYISDRVCIIRNEMQKVVQNNFKIDNSIGGTDEFSEIYSALFETTQNIKTLIDEVYKRKVEQEQLISRQNDIRFKMLSSQINPHFLFNTLETIRMKSLANNDRDVAQTIKLLANILRHNLEVIHREVPLLSELDVISNYLDIQQVRFGDRISYDIICLCDVRDMYVLPLLIQPIVENSFIHGLESKVKGGFIYITIGTEKKDEGELLCIEIKDNGNGIGEDKLKLINEKLMVDSIEDITSSIGLINVQQRIKLFYGMEYGLSIQSIEGVETRITIKLPLIYKGNVQKQM